jgi:hypothetical protein
VLGGAVGEQTGQRVRVPTPWWRKDVALITQVVPLEQEVLVQREDCVEASQEWADRIRDLILKLKIDTLKEGSVHVPEHLIDGTLKRFERTSVVMVGPLVVFAL